ncbi:MAG: ion transporter [Gammaproteobacteria bacterium HGW-Gammaproteobacteria-4]|jgi:voltage-gated potassium channel|nr:MAG: ion transporter [Gammaproteobacteria bacterium HGW-Gammaproteobacteria-4]
MNLKTIIEGNDTTAGRVFDLTIQLLIVVSVITFSIETIPNLSESTTRLLSITETFVVSIFTLEYLMRVYVADKKRDYIFSFYGIVDLIAIAPFYLSLGIDLRSFRILRMLRLFRLFKLVRYNSAMRRFTRAFSIAKEEIVIFGVVTIMLLYLSAVGIYYFENEAQPEQFKSIFHSFWWAVATLTTVGYGDVYPVTIGGRVFTFLILMVGLGIVAVPAGLLASALSKARSEEQKEDE